MTENNRFHFDTLDALAEYLAARGWALPLSRDLAVLSRPLHVLGRTAPNRLVVQPMEGRDAERDGAPGGLTRRRYRRFAAGGAGMIWLEAVAVSDAARADGRQLWISERTESAFAALAEEIRRAAAQAGRPSPVLVVQLSHSGRYAASPLTAFRRPGEEPAPGRVAGDGELDAIGAEFAAAARWVRQAGFDAVDVKCCHGYLFAELLSAFDRPGKYGGSLETRACLLLDSVRAAASEGIPTAVRMSAFDAEPGGFGVRADRPGEPDFSEMKELAGLLTAAGAGLLNITAGNPYTRPGVNRPYDFGPAPADEPQALSVCRLLRGAREAKSAVPPGIPVVASGLSWLREFGANAAAGGIEAGWFDLAGFGRQAIAYPDFAADLLGTGAMRREKCCVTCSGCTRRMRSGVPSGCVVRDRALFPPVPPAR